MSHCPSRPPTSQLQPSCHIFRLVSLFSVLFVSFPLTFLSLLPLSLRPFTPAPPAPSPSQCFATSYAIAGLSVASGNPADHLVHRFTHRVVRGTLLACGRPDGRLSALTSAENAVCLSVSQASSIQSRGVTCESLTLGHNPAKLGLAAHNVALPSARPMYLCERLLGEALEKRGELPATVLAQNDKNATSDPADLPTMSSGALLGEWPPLRARCVGAQRQMLLRAGSDLTACTVAHGSREHGPDTRRSLLCIPGEYLSLKTSGETPALTAMSFLETFAPENSPAVKRQKELRAVFDAIDVDGGGTLDVDEFTEAMKKLGGDLTEDQARKIFREADTDGSMDLDFEEVGIILISWSKKNEDITHTSSHCSLHHYSFVLVWFGLVWFIRSVECDRTF